MPFSKSTSTTTNPQIGYSYVIFPVGSYYKAKNGLSGAISYIGTDFLTVLNQCRTAMGSAGGIIKLKTGAYSLIDEILVTSPAIVDGGDPVGKLGIWGEGFGTILTQATAAKNGITLRNRCQVDFRDFKLVMPTVNSGHGLASDNTGVGSDCGFQSSYFENVYVKGCDVTHSPWYLVNPFWSKFNNIWGRHDTLHGIACVIINDSATINYGNCTFNNPVFYAGGSSGTLLWIEGVNHIMNLNTFENASLATPSANALCLKGDVTHNKFVNADIEAAEKGILFTPVAGKYLRGNKFDGYIQVQSGKTGIDISSAQSGAGMNEFVFSAHMVAIGAGNYILRDHIGWQPRNVYNLFFDTDVATNIIDIAVGTAYSAPLLKLHSANSCISPNGGVTSISDGGTIAHGCLFTPNRVSVIGSVANEIVALTAVDGTNLTVAIKKRVDGSAGTAQNIYWKAGYYSE